MPARRTPLTLLACLALLHSPPAPGAAPPAGKAPRADRYGDPLPPGAVARLGTARLCHPDAYWLAFSPDGKTLAPADSRGTVRLWRVATGAQLRQVSMPGLGGFSPESRPLSFSPDGKLLAAGAGSGSVRVWDVATGELRHGIRTGAHAITAVAFSADGTRLAAGGSGGPVYLIDPSTGKLLGRWGGFTDVSFLAFSADGKVLVSASPSPEDWRRKTYCLWDVATGRKRREHTFATEGRAASQLSPDGRLVATATGDDRGLLLYDPFTGKQVRRLRGKAGWPWQVTFSADGRSLSASSGDGVARVWETASGKLAHSFRALPTWVRSVALSRDGKLLALVGRADDAIHVFDVSRGKELHAFAGHRSGALDVAFSADGKEVLTASRDAAQTTPVRDWSDWSLRRWDPASGRELAVTAADPGGEVRWTAFSPGGSLLLTVNHRGTLRLYDTRPGKELRRWNVPTRDVTVNGRKMLGGVAIQYPTFSPDGKTVLATCGPAVLRWDAATGKELPPLKKSPSSFGRLLPGPDGRALFVTEREHEGGPTVSGWHSLLLLDAASGRTLRRFPLRHHLSPPLAVSPDGRTLAAWDGKAVRVSEVAGGGGRARLEVPGFVFALAFSPDGRLLASGGGNGSAVDVWDLPSGRRLRRFAGHVRDVQSLAFSPDGGQLASAGYDNFVLVWRVPRGRTPPAARPSREDLERLWDALSGADAARAYRAVWGLADHPDQAVALVGKHLKPVSAADAKRVAALVKDLGDDDFAVRARATERLVALGELAAPALRKALAAAKDPDLRLRLNVVLRKLQPDELPPERLRALRAIEVLECAGTAGARKLLKELAGGVEGAWLSGQAKAALDRLERRRTASR
jgi:WD40 repeat protein